MAMPHKGPRDAIYTKPTIEVGLCLRREASENGMSAGEFIATVMAERYGLPPTNTAVVRGPQQELPMTG
jgi:hypothetical protein